MKNKKKKNVNLFLIQNYLNVIFKEVIRVDYVLFF